MEEAKVLIKELKGLIGLIDEKSENRIKEIAQWFKEHKDKESQMVFDQFMEKGLDKLGSRIDNIQREILKRI